MGNSVRTFLHLELRSGAVILLQRSLEFGCGHWICKEIHLL